MSDLREIELAVVPLRDSVLFPHVVQPITIGRTSSMRLLDAVDAKGALVAVLTQRAPSNGDGDVPVYEIRTCARVHTVTKSRHDPIRYVMLVEGVERVRLMTVTQRKPYMKARFEILPDVVPAKKDEAYEALRRNVRDLFCEIIARSPTLSNDLIEVVEAFEDPSTLTDFAAGTYPFLAPFRGARRASPGREPRRGLVRSPPPPRRGCRYAVTEAVRRRICCVTASTSSSSTGPSQTTRANSATTLRASRWESASAAGVGRIGSPHHPVGGRRGHLGRRDFCWRGPRCFSVQRFA